MPGKNFSFLVLVAFTLFLPDRATVQAAGNDISGPQGLSSDDGPHVLHCLKGDPGEKGPRGAPGPPGPPGPPGMMISESIHLIGTDDKIDPVSDSQINKWKLSHKVGSMLYHKATGSVEIKREGYYFIYSQMYYYDGSTAQMAHNTYINDNIVMESLASVISKTRKYNTKFHGGVFLLRVNDTISVHVPYTKEYYMRRVGSFFGAFLLHYTNN